MIADRAILALDLGTKLGWALHLPAGRPSSGVFDLRKSNTHGERFSLVLGWLTAGFVAEMPIGSVLAIEEPGYLPSGAAYRMLCGIRAVALLVAYEHGWTPIGVAPAELKKHATGKGNAKKPAMIAAAKRLTGRDMTDDEADAVLLLDYVRTTAEIETEVDDRQ